MLNGFRRGGSAIARSVLIRGFARKKNKGKITAAELEAMNKGGKTIVTEEDIQKVMDAARLSLLRKQQASVQIVGSDELRAMKDSSKQRLMILDQFRMHGRAKENWIFIYLKQLVVEAREGEDGEETNAEQVLEHIEELLLKYHRAGQMVNNVQMCQILGKLTELSIASGQHYALQVLINYKRYRVFPSHRQYKKLIRYYAGNYAALDILWNTYIYKRSDPNEYPQHMIHWWIRAYDGVMAQEDADTRVLFNTCKRFMETKQFDKVSCAILLKVLIGEDGSNALTEVNGSEQMMKLLEAYVSANSWAGEYQAISSQMELISSKQ